MAPLSLRHTFRSNEIGKGWASSFVIAGGLLALGFSCSIAFSVWKKQKAHEAYTRSVQLRVQGNALYKASRYDEALTKYLLAQDCLSKYTGSSIQDARGKAQLNCVMIYLDQGRYKDALRSCTAILQNVRSEPVARAKALFRRSRANEELQNFDASKEDLVLALELCPNDVDIRAALDRLKIRTNGAS